MGSLKSSKDMEAKQHYAVCVMNPDGGSSVSGIVKMSQTEGQKVKIVADIKGLTPGQHGFHIHQFGNLTEGCKTAGPHFNPRGKTHGGPGKEESHVGDLGNIVAGEDGVGKYEVEDELIMIHGEDTVIGRSFVCHKDVDDLGEGGHELSPTTGNAGARLACGVIGLSGPF